MGQMDQTLLHWFSYLPNLALIDWVSKKQATIETSVFGAEFVVMEHGMWDCLTAACKAFSLANTKGKGINELVIRSLDD